MQVLHGDGGAGASERLHLAAAGQTGVVLANSG